MKRHATRSTFWEPKKHLGLLGLLLVAGASQAQTLYNASGSSLYQAGDLVNAGRVQNMGTYVPAAGTLLVKGGDFYNGGTIAASAVAGTVKLQETSPTQPRSVALNGQALPNLTLDVPAGTNLTTNGTINGTLTLVSGHLYTTTATMLALGPGASIVGETDAHYVKGRVSQSRALSGTSPIDFGGTGFAVNPNGNSLPLSVERRAGMTSAGMSYGSHPQMAGNKSIDRVWALNSTTVTSPSAMTLRLTWLPDNDNGLSFAGTNAQVWRSDDNGSTWQPQGAVQDGSNRLVVAEVTRVNALYTVSTTAAPLPVILTAFQAQAQGAHALLSWQTASETNSAYFEVQASTDGTSWQALGRQQAAGTTQASRFYQYIDPSLTRYGVPVVHYRLHQVDADGTATYSPVRTVAAPSETGRLALFPNPTHQLTTLLGAQPGTPVQVLNATGRVVFTATTDVTGQATLSLPGGLAQGVYVVRVGTQALRLVLE
jgi:hypothetical protein